MGNRRRNGQSGDAFGGESDITLTDVDSALYGSIKQVDATKTVTRPVELSEITVDSAIQVRVGQLDPERIESYVQLLINGGEFRDPIVLYLVGDELLLADGFHRVESTRQALDWAASNGGTIAPLRATIRKVGGYAAALECSEDANLSHGKYLTKDDRKNILFRRLTRGHAWVRASDREIGRALAVAHTTVGRWRDEFYNGPQDDPDVVQNEGGANAPVSEKQEKVIGADNRPIRTDKIGDSNKKRGETKLQLKQRTIKELRGAVENLRKLEQVEDASQIQEWIDYLSKLWGVGEG